MSDAATQTFPEAPARDAAAHDDVGAIVISNR